MVTLNWIYHLKFFVTIITNDLLFLEAKNSAKGKPNLPRPITEEIILIF